MDEEPTARHTFSRTVDIYDAADPDMRATIVGHLLVEAMLSDLLRTVDTAAKVKKKTFYEKVQRAADLGLISETEAAPLFQFNKIRNKYAHQLDYRLQFDTVFELVGGLGRAGYDFSDETIYLDKITSAQWYGITGCVQEAVTSMFELLAWRTNERGGPDRLS